MKPLPSLAIVTQSEKMRLILSRVEAIAASDSTVLLIGETGVGKELFADYIHRASPRSDRPFVKIALSAMPHDLLESELFGHERGSFTSAVSEKKGLFELAHTGSLFLDDIDDVPLPTQSKLLRVLESQEVLRVGGSATIPIDVRLIAASKVSLKEMVEHGSFRADLYYRINVFPVQIPPLRERREDLPLLVKHFMNRFAPGKALSVSPEALEALIHYDWPGNVRELRNIMQRLTLFATREINLQDLPLELHDGHPVDLLVKACTKCFMEESLQFNDVISCLEVNLLKQALQETGGNRSQAAKFLGLSLSTLRDKLKKYGLENHADPG
jgi:transcriptional regulator with GAF, ATPase, and Fis domain